MQKQEVFTLAQSIRVVILSKAVVVGAYQRKLEELARLPGIELTAIVPPSWRDRRGEVRLTRTHTAGYELIAAPLVFNGAYHGSLFYFSHGASPLNMPISVVTSTYNDIDKMRRDIAANAA
ncbi:MAG: hypothetical protein HGA46_04755, partial [Chlorobiaceae bacterium]|nr:hypothetical protein [Chlorobiaceae bacterium]